MSEGGPSAAQSRVDAIADQLRRQILGGKYEPGERLPSERELATRIGAGRASVREALKQLEQAGMISIRPGGGARVVPLEESGLGVLPHLLSADSPSRDLVAQWLDVWELVLAGAARLAVERATDAEFAQAEQLIDRFVSPELSSEAFIATADAITELIAVASRNVVLRMVRNGLTHQLQERHSLRLQLRPARATLVPIVERVRDAVSARDAPAVEEGVRALVRQTREAILDAVAGPADA